MAKAASSGRSQIFYYSNVKMSPTGTGGFNAGKH
jgi:hypothetical protein